MAKGQIKITLKKSGIGYNDRQNRTLIGLGLRKVNRSKILADTPSVRGMIAKVAHLVTVEDQKPRS